MNNSPIVAVVGLGYVGLPLAIAFGSKVRTVGYDIKENLVDAYRKGVDPTGEVAPAAFAAATRIEFTSASQDLSRADYVIVAVPTPIDQARQPDLGPVVSATKTVALNLKKGAVVIYESTVYPGVTEDVCVPLLEKLSGMVWKTDFHVGYSPERINPGDREHTLTKITKVVAGDTPETLERVAALYGRIVTAGVYRTRSIKEAEAAKVIENTQRDLNIALMNELSIIFGKMGIDTLNVIEAAATKWNFLKFTPGLVGGHCIGVDPYYLTYKAQTLGYHPEIILAGRRINDSMGKHVAETALKMVARAGNHVKNGNVAVLGLTFKENCPDLRNTRVMDIIEELQNFGFNVLVHDPIADPAEAKHYYGIDLCAWEDLKELAALIIAVPHRHYHEHTVDEFTAKLKQAGSILDVKGMLSRFDSQLQPFSYWRL